MNFSVAFWSQSLFEQIIATAAKKNEININQSAVRCDKIDKQKW